MSSDRGWFESEDDYRERVARESDERIIEDSTGAAPSKGWFESDDDYRDRISREANERVIEDSSGSAPSKGWFESDTDYRDRLSREANERIVEDTTGSTPSKGWFEDDADYEIRIRKEANEQSIQRSSGAVPQKGWFEGDHAYRSRIAHEARQLRANAQSSGASVNDLSDASGSIGAASSSPSPSSTSTSSSSSGFGCLVAIIFVICGILGSHWFAPSFLSESRNPTGDSVTVQSRRDEAIRLAEHTRAAHVFPGIWGFLEQTDRRYATVEISRNGDKFVGEYRSGGHREPLSGSIQADNRLRLVNDRQFCKIVQPGTWYEGDFAQEAWLQIGTNDSILFVSFSERGPSFMMSRIDRGSL